MKLNSLALIVFLLGFAKTQVQGGQSATDIAHTKNAQDYKVGDVYSGGADDSATKIIVGVALIVAILMAIICCIYRNCKQPDEDNAAN